MKNSGHIVRAANLHLPDCHFESQIKYGHISTKQITGSAGTNGCTEYKALHRLENTSGLKRSKKSTSNIVHCDNLKLCVKITAQMRAFRLYPI